MRPLYNRSATTVLSLRILRICHREQHILLNRPFAEPGHVTLLASNFFPYKSTRPELCSTQLEFTSFSLANKGKVENRKAVKVLSESFQKAVSKIERLRIGCTELLLS